MNKFFLALFTSGLLAQLSLVSAAPQFRVLTAGPDGCTSRKVAVIKAAVAEATQVVNAAVAALDNPQVINSRAFLDFLGQGNDPKKINTGNFQPIQTALSSQLIAISDLRNATATDVVFICPPDKEELSKIPPENPLAKDSKETCRGTFFAVARNGRPNNIIRLCPNFFDKRTKKLPGGTRDIEPIPLETAAKRHVAGERVDVVQGMTIVHEIMHTTALFDNNRAVDRPSNFIDPITGAPPPPEPGTNPKVQNPAYTADQCIHLPSAENIKNAQNYAWFAFDVLADRTRGLPCTASSSTTATSSTVTPSSTPKPGNSKPSSPRPPAKPLARRAKSVTTPAKVAKPPTVAAKPKPNPLGGGTAPSGPRLARPARLSSSTPSSTSTPSKSTVATGAKNGAKVGAAASIGAKQPAPASNGKVAPPSACNVIRRAIIQPISAEGEFVP